MELVCSVSDLETSDRVSAFVDDVPVLAVRFDEQIHVIEDVCTHDGQPLTDGPVQDCAIACPRHGAKFDLKTGKALCMPATTAIRILKTEVRDGSLYAEF